MRATCNDLVTADDLLTDCVNTDMYCLCVYICVCVCVCVCKQTCDCFKASCDAVSGQCRCSPGWTGLRCDRGNIINIIIGLLTIIKLLVNLTKIND